MIATKFKVKKPQRKPVTLPKSRWALLLEDDPAQFETVRKFLETHFQSIVEEVILAKTESDFVQILEQVSKFPDQHPDFVVSDVMMPWTTVDEIATNPQPQDVEVESYQAAGTRCWKRFRKLKATESVPWVFFTVLEEDRLRNSSVSWDQFTGYVNKDKQLITLAEAIEELTNIDWAWEESDEMENERVKSSSNFRRILIEGLDESLGNCVPFPT